MGCACTAPLIHGDNFTIYMCIYIWMLLMILFSFYQHDFINMPEYEIDMIIKLTGII